MKQYKSQQAVFGTEGQSQNKSTSHWKKSIHIFYLNKLFIKNLIYTGHSC